MNDLPFEGRTAVVTGGADGIGRATAVRLALGGARVFAGDIQSREENNQRFAKLGITALVCDVRSDADVRKLIETAVAANDRLDILVNNAGIGLVKQIPDVTEEEWDRCLDTNFKAAFLTAKYAIGPMARAAAAASSTFRATPVCCLVRTIRFTRRAKGRSSH